MTGIYYSFGSIPICFEGSNEAVFVVCVCYFCHGFGSLWSGWLRGGTCACVCMNKSFGLIVDVPKKIPRKTCFCFCFRVSVFVVRFAYEHTYIFFIVIISCSAFPAYLFHAFFLLFLSVYLFSRRAFIVFIIIILRLLSICKHNHLPNTGRLSSEVPMEMRQSCLQPSLRANL